jgi:hypothetical protein
MKSLIHRVLISILTIAMVYAFLPAQKVMADPLSLSQDSLALRVYETAFVTISGGGGNKSYGVGVPPGNDVAGASKIRDTILVIGFAEGWTLITVYDFDTGERCYLNVNVTGSKVLEAPELTVTTAGNTLTLSWSRSLGADGYILYFAPPYIPSLGKCDLGYIAGPTCTISGELWSGAAYYVIIQAYDAGGFSNFSNVGYFIIE